MADHQPYFYTTFFFTEDGLLQLSDTIKELLPNADFAFLSACQTATWDESHPGMLLDLVLPPPQFFPRLITVEENKGRRKLRIE